jgi:hypothetical protein
MNKNPKKIKHFLSDSDVDPDMNRKQCVGLGLEIFRFKDYLGSKTLVTSIERRSYNPGEMFHVHRL